MAAGTGGLDVSMGNVQRQSGGTLGDQHPANAATVFFENFHQELLEAEEASFLREKRYLEAETLAVEELLKGKTEAEGDTHLAASNLYHTAVPFHFVLGV